MSLEQPADESNRKRLKESPHTDSHTSPMSLETPDSKLVEELTQELQCGCCAELVYKPVLVMPCQHFFCGRCYLCPHFMPNLRLTGYILAAVIYGFV